MSMAEKIVGLLRKLPSFNILFFLFIIVNITAAGITYIFSTHTEKILYAKAFANLESVRDARYSQIKQLFRYRLADIRSLANSPSVIGFAKEAKALEDSHELEFNERLDVNEADVLALHKKYETYFSEYIAEYGYRDLFLIDHDDGHVMFTVKKGEEYGSTLLFGPMQESALAQAWKKTVEKQKTHITDMRPYGPGNDEPVMYIANPVYKDGVFIAVLVIQICDTMIMEIMKERSGLEKTGESYLVGEDALMRSNSFLDPKGHSLRASFANPETGDVRTKAVDEALRGIVGSSIITDYRSKSVLSSYRSISIGGFKWAVIAEEDAKEVLNKVGQIKQDIYEIAALWFVSILFIGYYAIRFIIKFSVVDPLLTLQKEADTLQYSATYDYLTKIYNRQKFSELFTNELNRTRRYHDPMSLVMIDIDFFKKINDTYGHDIGDNVLNTLASHVRSNMRKIDVFARWGGEEFVMLLPGTDIAAAYQEAKRLCKEIEEIEVEGTPRFTCSFGVTTFKEGDDERTMFKRADRALYAAKEAGRNRVEMVG